MLVSIIVPALNEEMQIESTLLTLEELAGSKEIIVVDGGSTDRTIEIARSRGIKVLQAMQGRGPQMHAGALAAAGDVLWFVHADTTPPPNALSEIERTLRLSEAVAGNFSLVFDGHSRAARQLTRIYPFLRKLGLCYGDSGIFVRRWVYEASGGFAPIPLFEDLDLLRRLRPYGPLAHLDCCIMTSSRRFEHRNFAAMWAQWTALQLLFWCGVSPKRLQGWYSHVRR